MGIARNIARLIPNGSGELPTANIANNAINAAKIATGAVGADELLVGSGGAIESGSNSYGKYVKFADGTLIQTGMKTMSYASNVTSAQVTFPISFFNDGGISGSNITSYSFSGINTTSHGDPNAATPVLGRREDGAGFTTNWAGIGIFGRTNLSASYGSDISWIAIGRWKA